MLYFIPSSNRVFGITTRHPERHPGRETILAPVRDGFQEVSETTVLINRLPTLGMIQSRPQKVDGDQASGLERFLVDWGTTCGIEIINNRLHHARVMTGNGFALRSPRSLGQVALIRGTRDDMKMTIGEKEKEHPISGQ